MTDKEGVKQFLKSGEAKKFYKTREDRKALARYWGLEHSAKSKALKKKSSADHINAERKHQGYKPLSAKDKRIFEGMDKYL